MRHLRKNIFDPATAPTFRWPAGVVEAYNQEEAAKSNIKEPLK